ncbi:STAS domain-containing protein [Phocaeicola sp.]
MEIEITKEKDINIVSIIGRLDTTTAGDFEKAISPLFYNGSDIVFDCSNLSYISSSGLRIFLMAYKRLSMMGGSLLVRHVCDDIMDVFNMTGFGTILRIEN